MNDKKTIEEKDNSINISEETLQDIAIHINKHCNTETIINIFNVEKITSSDVADYIISTINSNLQYDFNFTLE